MASLDLKRNTSHTNLNTSLSELGRAGVVIGQHFKPRWCIGIGIGIDRGKSLTCITVESMTSPIVIT